MGREQAEGGQLPERTSEIERVYEYDEQASTTVSSYVENETILTKVTGDLDIYSCSALQEVVKEQLEANRDLTQAELDLSDVTFLGSEAVGILTGSYIRMRQDGPKGERRAVRYTVVARKEIAKLFEITGLDRVFDVQIID